MRNSSITNFSLPAAMFLPANTPVSNLQITWLVSSMTYVHLLPLSKPIHQLAIHILPTAATTNIIPPATRSTPMFILLNILKLLSLIPPNILKLLFLKLAFLDILKLLSPVPPDFLRTLPGILSFPAFLPIKVAQGKHALSVKKRAAGQLIIQKKKEKTQKDDLIGG